MSRKTGVSEATTGWAVMFTGRWYRRGARAHRPGAFGVGRSLHTRGLGETVVQPGWIVLQHMEFSFDHHRGLAVLHRFHGAHFDHALRSAGRAERTRQRHGSEQEMALLLARTQRHHEALQAD